MKVHAYHHLLQLPGQFLLAKSRTQLPLSVCLWVKASENCGSGKPHNSPSFYVCLPFFSFQPLSCRGGTGFTLPFVSWAEPCQGRVEMVAQLPQPPSPPPLLIFPRAGMGKAAWEAGCLKGPGHPCLAEHGLKFRPKNPLLADTGVSWESILNSVISVSWTDA